MADPGGRPGAVNAAMAAADGIHSPTDGRLDVRKSGVGTRGSGASEPDVASGADAAAALPQLQMRQRHHVAAHNVSNCHKRLTILPLSRS